MTAALQKTSNPLNTVYGVKRLLGRRYKDVAKEQFFKGALFKVRRRIGFLYELEILTDN